MCHLEIHIGVVPLISERFLDFAFGAEKSTTQRQLFRRGNMWLLPEVSFFKALGFWALLRCTTVSQGIPRNMNASTWIDFPLPARKSLSSPSPRHWFWKCWMGWEVMELGTLRLQSLQVFLCYVMNKLIFAHVFHVQLGIVEQTIIDSWNLRSHSCWREIWETSIPNMYFAAAKFRLNDFSWSARGINLRYYHLPCLLSFSESGGKSNNVRRITRHNYLVVQCIIQRATTTH